MGTQHPIKHLLADTVKGSKTDTVETDREEDSNTRSSQTLVHIRITRPLNHTHTGGVGYQVAMITGGHLDHKWPLLITRGAIQYDAISLFKFEKVAVCWD